MQPVANNPRGMNVPTIKDMAQAAGVSIKTASRVLNGQETVRSYLRDRVERAMMDLKYQPNLAARQLSSRRSFVIGMIVPRAGVGYIPRFVVALSSICRALGFQLVTEAIDLDERQQAFRQGSSFALVPDAIVLAPRFADDPELLARFAEQQMPIIRLAGSEGLYGTVVHLSDEQLAAEVVRHLLSRGHRRIGFIGMPLVNRIARERYAGYLAALDVQGSLVDDTLACLPGFTYGEGATAAHALLSASDRPTAIFAASDTLAAGAQAQAQAMGLSVPSDVAIAGFDDSPIARAVFPPLTSVSFPIDAVAEATARAAIFGEIPVMTVDRNVIVRASTSGDGLLCADPYEG